jgi:hypothetical protein
MQKIRLFAIIIITILAVAAVLFAVMYFLDRQELLQARQQLKAQQTNEKVLVFAKLFVDKVLLGEGTVSFDDRLSLENAVRDISDKEIFSDWQEFTNSQSDKESQAAVGNLLKLLFNKIYQ